jgi:Spy/CpxP family protein refolding chaperone
MKQLSGIFATLLLGTGAMLGCGGSAATRAPAASAPGASAESVAGASAESVAGASAEEEDATAGLVEHHRHHHHGGVTLLIAMSLDTLGLSPEQKPAVERIRSDLHARMEPARAAEQNLLGTLADGLAAGAVDPAKVDAAVARLTSAAAGVHDASTDALNQLHAVLTPPQRAALVDKVEAHWSVWQRANTDENDHLTELTADLALTPDQVDKIRASQAEAMKAVPRFDAQEVAAHIRSFADAFRAPAFDAKALATGAAATAQMVAWGGAHMAHLIESASPVLTPEQRGKLAAILREHAKHNPSTNGG